jgi:transposase
MEEARMEVATRKPYPGDVSDEEWHFVLPYLTLMREDAPPRRHDLREVFSALRWLVRTGAQRAYLPHECPAWPVAYQQGRRWIAAGVLEAMAHDLRALLRVASGREPEPTAVILDSRTLQSTPMSGGRAAYDGAKRKRGSKVHLAVDTLGHLLALRVSPADAQDRARVAALLSAVQEVTDHRVEVAYVDQGYPGEQPAAEAAARGIELVVVRLPEAKRGFVLLPKRWVAERSFAWLAKFRRLARDYERAPAVLAGLHLLALVCLLLARHFAPVAQVHNCL